MSIAKTLFLSLACTLLLATHSAPSFAAIEWEYTKQDTSGAAGGGDGESLWDYICSWLM
jgi:uncharacterized membrane protein